MEANKLVRTSFYRIVDSSILLFVFLLVHKVYFGDLEIIPVRMIVLLFSLGAAYAVCTVGGMYHSRQNYRLSEELSRLTVCLALAVLTTGLFAFLSKIAIDVSRLWFGLSMFGTYLTCCGYRIAHRFYLAWRSYKGWYRRSIIIAGSGPLCQFTLNQLQDQLWVGIKVDGVFDDELRENSGDIVLSGNLAEVVEHVESRRCSGNPIDEVWITLPLKEEDAIFGLMDSLKDTSTDVCIVPSLIGNQMLSGARVQIADLSVINVSEIRLPPFGAWFKTVFDYLVAFIAVVVLSPVMLLIAILIRMDSPGTILFKQRRYGIDGQDIEVWKFRSMSVSEDGHFVNQAKKNDARVTKLGKFLRKTSLDELPQFFNVLQGKMSVVGPRPHAVSHNEEYRTKISGYMMRHKIKPGITGLAQINGWRGETDTVEKMEQRVYYDLEYIRTWSAWLDIKIVLLTLVRGFNDSHAY